MSCSMSSNDSDRDVEISVEPLRKKLKKLTYLQMEDFLIAKVDECIFLHQEKKRLRDEISKSKKLEQAVRSRYKDLEQQVIKMSDILKRYQYDVKLKGQGNCQPFVGYRSVGVQFSSNLPASYILQFLNSLEPQHEPTCDDQESLEPSDASLDPPDTVTESTEMDVCSNESCNDQESANPSQVPLHLPNTVEESAEMDISQNELNESCNDQESVNPSHVPLDPPNTVEESAEVADCQNESNDATSADNGNTDSSCPRQPLHQDDFIIMDDERKQLTVQDLPTDDFDEFFKQLKQLFPNQDINTLAMPNSITPVTRIKEEGAIASTINTDDVANIVKQEMPDIFLPQEIVNTVDNAHIVNQDRNTLLKHPADLPISRKDVIQFGSDSECKLPPPVPDVRVAVDKNVVKLTWNMTLGDQHATIQRYDLYAYAYRATSVPRVSLWKKIGNVEAMTLPMAAFLTLEHDLSYYFAVRAVDVHMREGEFRVVDEPCDIKK